MVVLYYVVYLNTWLISWNILACSIEKRCIVHVILGLEIKFKNVKLSVEY